MLRGSGSTSRLTSDLWGWGCGEGRERETEERKVLLQITPSFRLLIFVKCAIREAGEFILIDFYSTVDLNMMLWKPLHIIQFR